MYVHMAAFCDTVTNHLVACYGMEYIN
jgi:hypothetical protein